MVLDKRFRSLREILGEWLSFNKLFRLSDWDGAEGIEYGLDKESGLQGIETTVWPLAVKDMLHAAAYRGEVTDELLHQLCRAKYREGAGAWPHSAANICVDAKARTEGFGHREQLETHVLLRFVSQRAQQVILENRERWKMTPGMFEFQRLLLQRDCKAAVCTSACRLGYLDSLLEIFGNSEHFAYMMGAEDCQELGIGFKPNVDPFLHCLHELSATTDDGILVVEDNPKNLAMAVHGLRMYGYQNVFGLFIGRPARDQSSNEQFFRSSLIAADLESAAVEIYSRTVLINYDELQQLPDVLKSALGVY